MVDLLRWLIVANCIDPTIRILVKYPIILMKRTTSARVEYISWSEAEMSIFKILHRISFMTQKQTVEIYFKYKEISVNRARKIGGGSNERWSQQEARRWCRQNWVNVW